MKNFVLRFVFSIIIGCNILEIVSCQSISTPNMVTSCCNVTVSADIDPFISSYVFEWRISSGSNDVLLAQVGLDGRGNVLIAYDSSNMYANTYTISNSPSTLDPNNAPFTSSLTLPHNESVCGYTIIVRASPLESQVQVPCSADCSSMGETVCPSGCFCSQSSDSVVTTLSPSGAENINKYNQLFFAICLSFVFIVIK